MTDDAAELRFRVFGKLVAVARLHGGWQAYYLGNEGKRRSADFIIPCELAGCEIREYLADLFHEEATPRYGSVDQLDQ